MALLNQGLEKARLVSTNQITEVGCYHCGSFNFISKGKNKTGKRSYKCKDCGKYFVENPTQKYLAQLDFSDDVWDISLLGIEVAEYNKRTRLVFSAIHQEWLKDYAKKFIWYAKSTKKLETLLNYLTALNKFSEYLSNNSISKFEDINRGVIIGFLDYLSRSNLSIRRKIKELSSLKVFFETGAANSWFNVSPYLICNEDFPKAPQTLPRYIPEEVMQQLNQHLDSLPEPVMRMVLVIQECGLRVGELLQLPINCLRQDTKNNHYIQFMRWKMNKEDTLPVSLELATVIQNQQEYIQDNLGGEFEYLFCARKQTQGFVPKPAVMKLESFLNFLKNLADQFDIKDSSGKRWNFQSHQFRHTVGTKMINNSVPQHIVQRYLGHSSPTMTSVYAHVHDETLRKEIEKYHETRVVNIAGQLIELERSSVGDEEDLEWFRKTVLAMALPHGWCGRPKVLGHCNLPPNSCLNCAHLRTNKNFLEVFKDELKRTSEILAKARNYGWEVQVKMNEPIKANLEKMIAALETDE